MLRHLLFIFSAWALSAQSFEVALIKPAPPPNSDGMSSGATGGPGTRDPGRWTAENMTVRDLIMMAYGIQRFQISGPPWFPGELFNIQAKVPEGATREQVPEMLRNLLAERFQLRTHWERKESATYRLVVAKNGPKLQLAEPRDPNAVRPKITSLKQGPDGFPELPPGVPIMLVAGGRVLCQAVAQNMEGLASTLARQVGRQVTDATGLRGKYDFLLKWDRGVSGVPGHSADAARLPEEVGPDLFTALQDQLGLRLEPSRGEVEILVVDHVEKTPTGN